ncbi:hypothetical protein GO283_05040 [Ralstonia solanacearum]|nr:hypothetical protein [Ralstonia solanacearum]NKA76246.1 hypothetical protein [Ralstonia solanacearum]NKA96481.1 hypothetical protein [Ralstonia solanacearum]NKF57625.1 hypothetical protein [Ralstonia solanacearum]NKF62550.1 hypothetical protein [Ralstonia solanacearum]
MARPVAGAAAHRPACYHAAAEACRRLATRRAGACAGAGRSQTDRDRAVRAGHADHHNRARIHRQRRRRHRQVLGDRGDLRDLRSVALRLRGAGAVQPRRRLGQGRGARHDRRQRRGLLRHRPHRGGGAGGGPARAGAGPVRATGAVRPVGDSAGGLERRRPSGAAAGERQRRADLHGQRPGRQRPQPLPGQSAGAGQPAHRRWRLHVHRCGGPAQVRHEHDRHGRLRSGSGGLQGGHAGKRRGFPGQLPARWRSHPRSRHRRDRHRPGEPGLRLHHHPVAAPQAGGADRVLHGAGQVV